MAFQDTPNKEAVRRQWDLPILTSYAEELGHSLAYFGLPGERIRDLVDWKDVLGYRTGVELLHRSGKKRLEQLRLINRMQSNIMLQGLGSQWQLLRGTIEDVILDGHDIDGTLPALNNGDEPYCAQFHYDLYNLDFIGGIGYADTQGESQRIRAIRKLFERQKGHDFLMLLTINVRDTMGEELSKYLLEVGQDSRRGKLRDTLVWYANAGRGMKKHKLKSALPIFLQDFARHCSFSCLSYPPLAYRGYKALMVHFVFRFTFVPGRNLPVRRHQRIEELLSLPLVEIEDGAIAIAGKQHPGFDFSQCQSHLSFLPDQSQADILERL